MSRIASDTQFIEETLANVIKVDEFTRNLLDISRYVQREGLAQPAQSCINRADYMMDRFHTDGIGWSDRIRQVEVNTIASGLSSQSFKAHQMHDYLLNKYQIKLNRCSIPDNDSFRAVAQGLIDGFDAYGRIGCYVLLVAEEMSLNFADHLSIELTVHETRPDIKFVRVRFIDLPPITKLGPNKELLLDRGAGTQEIALVYFRFCYDPSNYCFDAAWETRLLLERSLAIKCPSINFHLAGAKKFQQVLDNPMRLERFLDSKDATRLSQVFCKFWSLEPDARQGKEGYDIGLNASRNLVLKPQREGGGHNVFGEDIKVLLSNIADSDQRLQYILMEYINSPKERNWLMSYDDAVKSESTRHLDCDQLVSELGIYGSVLADRGVVRSNRVGGYLVRSKKFGVKEGGVASGFAGISSLLLVDDDANLDSDSFFVVDD